MFSSFYLGGGKDIFGGVQDFLLAQVLGRNSGQSLTKALPEYIPSLSLPSVLPRLLLHFIEAITDLTLLAVCASHLLHL